MGSTCALVSVLVSVMVKYGRIKSTPGEYPPTLNDKMTFSILNVNEIGKNIERVMCVPLIRVKTILEWEVIYPRGEMIIKPCKRKLMI